MMALRRLPLASFLATARRTLREGIANSTPLHLVIGNESADIDSLLSAITYAYLRTYTTSPQVIHIPLSNLPFPDLALRTELSPILAKLNLQDSDLLTLSDLPAQEDRKETLNPQNTKWILVDHNSLQGELGRVYGERVVGCIDHHVDEDSIPENVPGEPRVIEVSGSCTSLVVNYFLPMWKPDEQLDISLAWLGLAPILIDTQCLTNSDKVTAHDISAAECLEGVLNTADVGYDREVYHQAIYDAKQDISHLSLRDILRKDYKLWIEADLNLGIACSVQPVSFLVSKAGGEFEKLVMGVEDFAQERGLGVVSVMTAFTDEEGTFGRELFVMGCSEEGRQSVGRFERECTRKLGLVKIEGMESGERVKVWRQERVECSRKQVAPLLRDAVRAVL